MNQVVSMFYKTKANIMPLCIYWMHDHIHENSGYKGPNHTERESTFWESYLGTVRRRLSFYSAVKTQLEKVLVTAHRVTYHSDMALIYLHIEFVCACVIGEGGVPENK